MAIVLKPEVGIPVSEGADSSDLKEKAEAAAEGGEPEDQQWEFDPSANKPDLKIISG